MRFNTLGKTGLKVSALSFGASPFGGAFGKFDESTAAACIRRALELGLNYIDVAPFYGNGVAETMLGKALRGIPRDRYILATKVGRYGIGEGIFDFSAQRTNASIDESLARLGVEYVDVMQCHDIEHGSLPQVVSETIPALRAAQTKGKLRFIGVTGLPLPVSKSAIEQADVDLVLSYCHHTLQNAAYAEYLPAFQHRGLGIVNASPLAMGLLTHNGPPAWHPAVAPIRARCAEAAKFCAKRGADLAKLALQFATSNPGIHTTLSGIGSLSDLERNARWIDEPLDAELLREVQTLLAPVHNQSWHQGRAENYPVCNVCKRKVGEDGYVTVRAAAICLQCHH